MRSRITITLSESILEQVDKTIDSKSVRNRSQAIERLLQLAISPTIQTVVVLAGGPETLDPRTKQKTAKALVTLKNVPVISHLLRHLDKSGVKRIIICTSHQAYSQILKAVSLVGPMQAKVEYVIEKKLLGTGGALRNAAKAIGSDDFMLVHGDIVTDIDLNALVSFYNSEQVMAVVAVKPRPGRLSYGRVFIEGNRVVDFKTPVSESPISLVSSGIYVFSNQVLKYLPDTTSFKLEDTLIPKLVELGQIKASVFQGLWFDVTDPDSIVEADDRVTAWT